MAIAMGLIFFIMIRAGAGCVVWTFIFTIIVCFLLLGTLFLQKYSETKPNSGVTPHPVQLFEGKHTLHEMILKHSHDLVEKK